MQHNRAKRTTIVEPLELVNVGGRSEIMLRAQPDSQTKHDNNQRYSENDAHIETCSSQPAATRR